MGLSNKLLRCIDNLPMINHTVNAAVKSNLNDIYIVTGYESDRIKKTLFNFDVKFIRNTNWEIGMASSISVGLQKVKSFSDGLIIILGDMPLLEVHIINSLIKNFRNDKIIIPTKNGKKGNPIIFPAHFFRDLESLKGDVGAKLFIESNQNHTLNMEVSSNSIFYDFDIEEHFK